MVEAKQFAEGLACFPGEANTEPATFLVEFLESGASKRGDKVDFGGIDIAKGLFCSFTSDDTDSFVPIADRDGKKAIGILGFAIVLVSADRKSPVFG